MNIAVCGDCLWIGVEAELAVLNPETAGPLEQVIASNGLILSCCPKCGESKIFRKPGRTYQFDSVPNASQVAPAVSHQEFTNTKAPFSAQSELDEQEVRDELDELDSDIVADLLDSAEEPSLIVEEDEEVQPKKKYRQPDIGRKMDCDSCGRTFTSKYDTGRCPECDAEMLKKFAV